LPHVSMPAAQQGPAVSWSLIRSNKGCYTSGFGFSEWPSTYRRATYQRARFARLLLCLPGDARAVESLISGARTQRAHCLILFSAFCLSPKSSAAAQRVSLPAQVAIKKLDDHVQRIPGLRNIYVVEETVEESFPHMQFRINS
jgi:hypothetical protein